MKHRYTESAGFAIIELMVGVLIISFGLLGLITLQGRAVQMSVGSEDSQRAALLANEIASEIFNQSNVTLSEARIKDWNALAATPATGGLPNGTVTVTPIDANQARVTVNWRPVQAAGTGADVTHNYTTVVVIP